MDVSYTESWASRPDVCRCCMTTSGTWDLTAFYITQTGENEEYSKMLQECYGISLSYLMEWGPSRMACSVCIGHLREAVRFRKQVLLAEQQFVTLYNSRTTDSKLKPAILTATSQKSTNRSGSRDDDSIDVLALTNATERPVVVRVDRETYEINKEKKNDQNEVSDIPTAEISKKKQDSNSIMDNEVDDNLEDNSIATVTAPIKGFLLPKPQNRVKPVSERKRVILTCDIILRNTTACPFRHHKSWFQCFFCQQDFMEINLLRDHTSQTHSNLDQELKKIKRYPRSLQIEISNLECRRCKLYLTDVGSMCRHFVEVHEKFIYSECIADYKVNGSPYSCHLCKQEFHVFRSLTTHLNEHYANCICDVCGKSFLNSKRLKVHKRTHENGHFPCSECGKILKTKTSKSNHIESAHSKRIIKCQICYEPMKHYNDRIKHMSEVHNITHKFKCPICSREYNIKHYLATHMRQTHGHRNKKCMECDMAFITNHGLKKHILV